VQALEDRSTPDATSTGVIVSGVVFSDLNGNGVQDAGETGLTGVDVRFDLGGNGTTDAIATTDDSGAYAFADIPSGVHAVILVPPSGTTAVGRPPGRSPSARPTSAG